MNKYISSWGSAVQEDSPQAKYWVKAEYYKEFRRWLKQYKQALCVRDYTESAINRVLNDHARMGEGAVAGTISQVINMQHI